MTGLLLKYIVYDKFNAPGIDFFLTLIFLSVALIKLYRKERVKLTFFSRTAKFSLCLSIFSSVMSILLCRRTLISRAQKRAKFAT